MTINDAILFKVEEYQIFNTSRRIEVGLQFQRQDLSNRRHRYSYSERV